MYFKNDQRNVMSSEQMQMLLDDRVEFMLYASEGHLNELKHIKQRCGTIMGPLEIRVKTEIEIDCFLAHLLGAKDSLLFQLNSVLGLGIPMQDVKLETANIELNVRNKGDLLRCLNRIACEKTSWFWLLNEIRNHLLHRERIARRANVNIGNVNDSDQTVHFVEGARTKGNPFLEQDIISFLNDSLERMRILLDNVRKKLAMEVGVPGP